MARCPAIVGVSIANARCSRRSASNARERRHTARLSTAIRYRRRFRGRSIHDDRELVARAAGRCGCIGVRGRRGVHGASATGAGSRNQARKVAMRHGVDVIRRGKRHPLGLIFHDSR
ncbi:2OG-Fe(II) oxygenase [Burkholderia paludis]|uniref:2OG-Fe(II) oxygenase n=1 Tax=Burkholderia paludis TaxID=1506587 RepID=UPI0034641CA5